MQKCHSRGLGSGRLPPAATWQQRLEPPRPGGATLGQVRPEGSSVPSTPDPSAPPASGELPGRRLPGRPLLCQTWRYSRLSHPFGHSSQCACVLRPPGLETEPGWAGWGGGRVAASLFPPRLDLRQDRAPCGGFSSTRKVFEYQLQMQCINHRSRCLHVLELPLPEAAECGHAASDGLVLLLVPISR